MICICIVPGCLSFMEHSFTVTTDTDVLIWGNESQLSFPCTDSNTSSEKSFNVFKINIQCLFKQLIPIIIFLQCL